MKKVVIVGGSNGIGLAIAKVFMDRGYHAVIADKSEPETQALGKYGNFTYYYTNLLNFDEDFFRNLAADSDIESLMVTAGFGRAAAFEYLHLTEIRNLMDVNASAGIQIISCFYERLKSKKFFPVE